MKTTIHLLIVCMATAALPSSGQTQTLRELLQAGLVQEEVDRDLEAAVESYSALIEQFDQQRRLAATAMFRLAESLQKLGRTNDARLYYSRIVREFPGNELAELSRGRMGPASAPSASVSGTVDDDELKELGRVKELVQTSPDLVNSLAGDGRTPLMNAVQKNYDSVARFLLNHGADVNLRDKNGGTALHIAVHNGNLAMINLLAANGADVNAPRSDGASPLHIAATRDFKLVAERLIELGADLNAKAGRPWRQLPRTSYTATPLHTAASRGNRRVANLLLSKGADVAIVDAYGATPLHLAAMQAQKETMALLLDQGADPNQQDEEGRSALYYAVGASLKGLASPDVVQLLLEEGADPLLPDSSGLRLLDSAERSAKEEPSEANAELLELLRKAAKTPPNYKPGDESKELQGAQTAIPSQQFSPVGTAEIFSPTPRERTGSVESGFYAAPEYGGYLEIRVNSDGTVPR